MSVITISRSLYSGGKVIALEVAHRLGYDCISDEVIRVAAFEHRVTEGRLVRAIHDRPSVLDRFTSTRERDLACLHEALLSRASKGRIVYHGLAGHFLLKGFPHVLKVRITACDEPRVAALQRQRGVSGDEALRALRKEDEARRRWSRKHYGIDQTDAGLYDIVINMDTIREPDAIDIICRLAATSQFQKTPEAARAMEDAALASRVRIRLIGLIRKVEVSADGGSIYIKTHTSPIHRDAIIPEIRKLAMSVPGVREVNVETYQIPLFHE